MNSDQKENRTSYSNIKAEYRIPSVTEDLNSTKRDKSKAMQITAEPQNFIKQKTKRTEWQK